MYKILIFVREHYRFQGIYRFYTEKDNRGNDSIWKTSSIQELAAKVKELSKEFGSDKIQVVHSLLWNAPVNITSCDNTVIPDDKPTSPGISPSLGMTEEDIIELYNSLKESEENANG